jgi:hypothetical protein
MSAIQNSLRLTHLFIIVLTDFQANISNIAESYDKTIRTDILSFVIVIVLKFYLFYFIPISFPAFHFFGFSFTSSFPSPNLLSLPLFFLFFFSLHLFRRIYIIITIRQLSFEDWWCSLLLEDIPEFLKGNSYHCDRRRLAFSSLKFI